VSSAPENKRRLIWVAKSHPAGAAQHPGDRSSATSLVDDGERRP
jgi:hypothetical protein